MSSCRSVDCWEWSSSGPLDEDRADRLPPRLSPLDCRERERERAVKVNTREIDAPKSRLNLVDISCRNSFQYPAQCVQLYMFVLHPGFLFHAKKAKKAFIAHSLERLFPVCTLSNLQGEKLHQDVSLQLYRSFKLCVTSFLKKMLHHQFLNRMEQKQNRLLTRLFSPSMCGKLVWEQD